jgi:V/A-type H+-transporting ATPase subunit K
MYFVVTTEGNVMKRRVVLLAMVLMTLGVALFAQEAVVEADAAEAAIPAWKFIAAALAVGLSCIAGGIAVGQIGAAAMGAMSENPELSGKALPFMGLAEGICLWGFLVALLILFL